jgi:hypothetical protein
MSGLRTTGALPVVAGVRFKEIVGFPGYCVGDDGSVWSQHVRGRSAFVTTWRQLRQKFGRSGCRQVTLRCHKGRASCVVHRLVLNAFVGPRPEGMECCHYDGDSTNNNLSNLRWDTHSANMQDQIRHGTTTCGTRNAWSKLTDSQVIEIRQKHKAGMTGAEIARIYGVSHTNISQIVQRVRWAHLPAENGASLG